MLFTLIARLYDTARQCCDQQVFIPTVWYIAQHPSDNESFKLGSRSNHPTLIFGLAGVGVACGIGIGWARVLYVDLTAHAAMRASPTILLQLHVTTTATTSSSSTCITINIKTSHLRRLAQHRRVTRPKLPILIVFGFPTFLAFSQVVVLLVVCINSGFGDRTVKSCWYDNHRKKRFIHKAKNGYYQFTFRPVLRHRTSTTVSFLTIPQTYHR